MKIVVFIPNLTRNTGGAEIYDLYFAKAISEFNDVIVLTSKPIDDDFRISDVYEKYGLPYMETQYFNMNYEIKEDNVLKAFILERYFDYTVNRTVKRINPDMFINGNQNKICNRYIKKSIYITHFPPKKYNHKLLSGLNDKYADSYSLFICNSNFTKNHLMELYNKDSIVLNPPIVFPPLEQTDIEYKENIILAVDRLVSDKCILEMIYAYKLMPVDIRSRFKFVIIGNTDTREMDYFSRISEESKNENIYIYSNVSYDALHEWYKKSKFFWHAKGFGVSDDDPEKMEHFGMTTVEAMINGCIPIVINKAGQKEIVNDYDKSCLWDDLDELKNITIDMIRNEDHFKDKSRRAIEIAKKYHYESFKTSAQHIIKEFI